MKKIILVMLLSILVISTAQAMTSQPSVLMLEGNTSEWLNGTIHFSDVPTETLSGYEKWTTDGKTLNRSLKANELDINLLYPKVVKVNNNKANVNISAKVEKAGNYTGAIFYRTEGQTGIAAGTWIKIIVSEETNNNKKGEDLLSHIWYLLKKFWTWTTGLFSTAEASATMNTTVNVISTPRPHSGGGGGASRDSDSDGYSDIQEKYILKTNPNDPCDPNANCAACLAIKPPTPIPTLAPTPTPISTSPPTIITPTQQPVTTPQPSEIPEPTEEKTFRWWIIVVIIIIIGVGLFVAWREWWRWR